MACVFNLLTASVEEQMFSILLKLKSVLSVLSFFSFGEYTCGVASKPSLPDLGHKAFLLFFFPPRMFIVWDFTLSL